MRSGGLYAIAGHDGFQATKGSATDKKGRFLTTAWISIATPAMRNTTTWIPVVLVMSENDKPGPTARHLPALFCQGLFKGPVTIRVTGADRCSFDLPLIKTMWVGDMAGLHNLLMLRQPKDTLWWSAVRKISRIATHFDNKAKYINFATPDRFAVRTNWLIDDVSVSDDDLKAYGYDVGNPANLHDTGSMARLFGIDEFSATVGLLHCHSDQRSNFWSLVAEACNYISYKQLQSLEAVMRKHGVCLRPYPRYGGSGIRIQAKQGHIVDACVMSHIDIINQNGGTSRFEMRLLMFYFFFSLKVLLDFAVHLEMCFAPPHAL